MFSLPKNSQFELRENDIIVHIYGFTELSMIDRSTHLFINIYIEKKKMNNNVYIKYELYIYI